MKKLLSTIMALVMLLSLVPMAVAEERVTPEKAVAQIGDQYYETLADAVFKVDNGDTIKLVKDVTGQVVIPAGKTITLDLGGKTLTNTKTAILNYGTLTVDNGTIVSAKDVGICAGDNSKTTIQPGVTIKGQEGAVITGYATGATITINGGEFFANDNAVIAGNGNKTVGKDGLVRVNANTITINGGTFTGNIQTSGYIACGIYAPWKDVITVNGGTFTVNNGIGVVCRAGQVHINGGTFICNGSAKGKVGDKNFDMDAAQALYFDDSNPSYPAYNKDTDGIFVKGGAFTDLASAVKYATNGAKITLAGNVALDKAISIGSSEGKTIVLDLGGKTLKGNIDFCAGDLTIQNGTIDGCVYANATETDVKYGHLTIASDAVIDSKYAVILYQRGVGAKNFGSTIDVYGTLKGNLWVMGNITTDLAAAKNPCEVNIHDGAVIDSQESSDIGIALNGAAKMTVGKARITSTTGIEVRAGELTVNGATVVGTGDCIEVNPNGSGTTTDGAGIAVAQHTTQLPIKVTINSGDISGCSALHQSNPQNNDAESVKRVSVAVNGGTFKAINGGTVSVYSENNCVAVSGGTFSSDPSVFVTDKTLVVVPENGTFTVKAATTKSEDGNTTTTIKVSEDGKTVTETKTETKVEGNVTTKTETVTVKDDKGNVTKVTETVTTVKTENGGTTTVVTKKDTLNKTETTEVTGVIAPTTASDVTLDVKNTTNVAVNKDSMTALTGDTVKDVVIETKQAKLKLDKTAVETMESKVATGGKMTLNVTVTEETNATTTDIEKVKVEVTAKNEAGENVFPENTANTNGLINITIPYTGNATQLDLWYIAANGSASYMGRFPVVKGFVSFDVKHFSQYDLIPVASSGSSVIKTGAGSSAASTTQTVTTDLTPGSITKVTVDGKVVDAKYYTVSGSNVTFTAEFLKTLKNGSHTVTVENATKIAKGVFTVNNPTTAVQAPTTADAGIALYAGMAIASVMGTGVVFTSRKRKNH